MKRTTVSDVGLGFSSFAGLNGLSAFKGLWNFDDLGLSVARQLLDPEPYPPKNSKNKYICLCAYIYICISIQ